MIACRMFRTQRCLWSLVTLIAPAAGQTFSISGTVSDAAGASIPGATVALTSAAAAGRRTATTDATGRYSFSGVAAGSYQLAFERAGFETVTRSGNLAADTEVNVQMPVAGLITSINVTDVAGKATATRLDVPDRDVPAQVSSIPAQLLQHQAVNSMVEALKNASGVQAQRWYGVYEYYTIRGFHQADVMLVDGMRLEGNRFNTQLNNVQSIEVLKGPSSVIYGQGAVGGAINIVRKKPQATRAYDIMYKGGRFNTHQVAGGATGPLAGNRLLYRLDASYDHSDGWRSAGADRFNASPSLTWLMGERARLTVHQAFNRDRFNGDGGVPVETTLVPDYDPSVRFSLPQDEALIGDSQTHLLLNANLSSAWEFRQALFFRKTSDRYFVTEYVYFLSSTSVGREALDFHHHRSPIQNQAELVGRFNFLGLHHTLLGGYEYRDHYYRTDVTAGDDPDCTCGYWYNTIAPIDIRTLQETTPRLDLDTIYRKTYNSFLTHAAYWQDQIEVLPNLKINIGGRYDDFQYRRHRIFVDNPDRRVGIQARDQTAYTYRAGIIYAPRIDHQIYFSSASSFNPPLDIPPSGAELKPRMATLYEVGHRWHGFNDRVQTSLAFYHIEENNKTFRESVVGVVQAGSQVAKGADLDVNVDLGWGLRLFANYGYSSPKFRDFEPFTGKVPRYVQKHATNAWLRKDWESGVFVSAGMRYLGPQFANNSNTIRLGGFTVFSGAAGYRQRNWEWALNADNLSDRARYFTGSDFAGVVYPGPPLAAYATVRLRFSE